MEKINTNNYTSTNKITEENLRKLVDSIKKKVLLSNMAPLNEVIIFDGKAFVNPKNTKLIELIEKDSYFKIIM